jgi:multisubunit Na+/H+ antiporter MnhE subunit
MLIEYIGMIVCFLGVFGLVFLKTETTGTTTYDPEDRTTGLLISFTLSWVFAATICFNRRLKNVNFAVVLFYHSIFGITLSSAYITIEKIISGTAFRFLAFSGK